MVLAAGRGERLGALAREQPKALLPVLGRPLFAWHFEALRALGVRSVVVVIGHLGTRLEAAMRAETAAHAGGGLELVFATQARPLGIADALACAAPHLTQPFLCLLGDVFFDPEDLRRVAAGLGEADAALGVRAGAGAREVARNFAVEVDAAGFARAVEEKPSRARAGWKGVGLYAFRPDFLAVARATPASALRNERELTDAIQRHIEAGARVRAVPCEGRDFNLSEPADLLAANRHALARSGQASWVDPSAELAPGVLLERSVVLARARLAPGTHLVDSLVLADQRVAAGRYRACVFAAGETFACPGAE